MFQTFSGSSRRPRQVNLSGQEPNPFAGWGGSSSASGTQKTVAAAQAERIQRQQERERLSASKRIQRVWRGHRSRKAVADVRRQTWDNLETRIDGTYFKILPELIRQFHLLVVFFNAQNPEDVRRLSKFSKRLIEAIPNGFLVEREMRPCIIRLARIILASLAVDSTKNNENLLMLLAIIVESAPEIIPKISSEYYEVLALIIAQTTFSKDNKGLLLRVLSAPLAEYVEIENGIDFSGYSPFVIHILPLENLSKALGNLQELAHVINIKLLSEALIHTFRPTSPPAVQPQSRLWLIAHFINLHRLQIGNSQEPIYMRALSLLLSISANEIVNRIDIDDPEFLNRSGNDEDLDVSRIALPKFVNDELITLVDKQSVTELLAKFNIGHITKLPAQDEYDASLLASYALMLLRLVPRLGEEIRMWLYQSSVAINNSGTRIPALKFFWRAMSITSTFSAVSNDSKSALAVLCPRPDRHSLTAQHQEDVTKERDWRSILLFLELYAFVLRFTDDEEFLNGGAQSITEPEQPILRSRENALPLQDVRLLTVFLKNLSFTMYFNESEILDDRQVHTEGGLGSYFGSGSSMKFQESAHKSPLAEEGEKKVGEDRDFLGIAGMTFDYVRRIVTRVMRMLYERNSRRRFLPKDHWLMTSRFDMEGFIPAVVSEEGRRHEVVESGEDVEDGEVEEPIAPVVIRRQDLTNSTERARRLRRSEQLSIQQKNATRKKMLAAVTPRLQILQHMPYAIPFETRVQIFRQFVYQDQVRRRGGRVDPDQWRMAVMHGEPQGFRGNVLSRHHAKIRRDQIFEDAYEQFYGLGDGLKEPIQITFVDKFDTIEAGIDGGGVTKEFLTSVTNEAFQSPAGRDLFVTNDQNLLYPNPTAVDERRELLRLTELVELSPKWTKHMQDFLRRYEFLGRIVGKCLYEGILLDVSFAGFFLLKWASTRANINDLRDLDESLYQGLLQLKNYPNDVSDFALDFTINDSISMAGEPTRTITRNLIPNGSNSPVTNENRLLYVLLVARHRLYNQPRQQTSAFLRGLWDIINPSWLSMFNQVELQTLIGGDSSEIDVDDLRRNTIYSGVYEIGNDRLEHPTILMFWEVMKNLDDSDRRKVLKYVTSTPRAPLLGFTQLNPRFSIRDGGSDQQRLPSTSTCINLLKLPRYDSVATLREKLLYAINSGAGFDLS